MTEAESIRPQELFLQANVTSRCNLSCTHCYSDDPPHDMDADRFAEVVRQFADLRSRLGIDRAWIQISGGEPLLHPELPAILEQSASQFATKALTNGVIMDSRTAPLLAAHCESAQISFDGDRDAHDRRRGAGSFDAALSGLRLLSEAGLAVSARVTVGTDNYECVEPLFRFLEPTISAFHFSRVVPIGGCVALAPDVDAYRRIIYRLYALRATNTKIGLREPFLGVLLDTRADAGGFCGCSAGISGLCVTQTGDIYPCRRLPIRLGNIDEDTLTDIYLNHPLLQRLRERDLTGKCGSCDHKAHCGGSRCVAYAMTGDPLAADPGCIFA